MKKPTAKKTSAKKTSVKKTSVKKRLILLEENEPVVAFYDPRLDREPVHGFAHKIRKTASPTRLILAEFRGMVGGGAADQTFTWNAVVGEGRRMLNVGGRHFDMVVRKASESVFADAALERWRIQTQRTTPLEDLPTALLAIHEKLREENARWEALHLALGEAFGGFDKVLSKMARAWLKEKNFGAKMVLTKKQFDVLHTILSGSVPTADRAVRREAEALVKKGYVTAVPRDHLHWYAATEEGLLAARAMSLQLVEGIR